VKDLNSLIITRKRDLTKWNNDIKGILNDQLFGQIDAGNFQILYSSNFLRIVDLRNQQIPEVQTVKYAGNKLHRKATI
jgi:hypothetical protein